MNDTASRFLRLLLDISENNYNVVGPHKPQITSLHMLNPLSLVPGKAS